MSDHARESNLIKTWRRLTEPDATLQKSDQRDPARLLSSLLVMIVPLGIAFFVLPYWISKGDAVWRDPVSYLLVVSIVAGIVNYRFSRSRHYKGAALSMIVTATCVPLVLALANNEPFYLIYLLPSVLLSSILLTLRATAYLIGIQMLGVIVSMMFNQTPANVSSTLFYLRFDVIISVLILMITHYRSVLEHNRQNELHEQIAERQRAEAAEHEQRVLAEALSEAAATINSTLNLNEILERILTSIQPIVPYDTASVMMIESGFAHVVCGRGFSGHGLDTDELLTVYLPIERHGNLKEMFETGKPVLISDTETNPIWRPVEETRWIRSYVAAPIRVEGHVIGFVNLDSATPDTFKETHAKKLLAFANQAGIALQNAELFGGIHQHASNLEVRVQERTAELERRHTQLQTIMDSMNEGLIGQFQAGEERSFVNAALTRMTGYTAEDWDFRQIKPADMSDAEFNQVALQISQTMTAQGVWEGEFRLTRRDKTEFDAYITASRMDDQEGKVIGSVTLIRDVSQEKQLEEQKSRFVANASHELRTPLTNLITRLYLLRKRPQLLDEHLEILDSAAEKMRKLVEDLLDYSRFERGVMPLKLSKVDLRDVVKEVMWMQQAEAERKQIRLNCDLGESPVMVEIDSERINQVITNLVINAIYYTPEGKTIRVSIETPPEEHSAIIHILDDGTGIPEKLLPNLFLPFHRGTENSKGTGLGLAIAREIVELHGGSIHVESKNGEGSDFSIRLPFLSDRH